MVELGSVNVSPLILPGADSHQVVAKRPAQTM
jgi:hypothetical protein